VVFQDGALAGAFEGDDLVPGAGERQHRGYPLLQVAVEAAEQHDGASARFAEPDHRQGHALVRRLGQVARLDAVDGADEVDEAAPGGRLARVVGGEEEVRGAVAERGVLLPYDWDTAGHVGVTDMTAGFHAGEFAFLSACQTATGGLANSDEAINLAAALQYAGWRHVIGTLWSIWDTSAAARGRAFGFTAATAASP
jgi:CHAT domain